MPSAGSRLAVEQFRYYLTGCEGRVEIESEWTARKRERAAGDFVQLSNCRTQPKIGLEWQSAQSPRDGIPVDPQSDVPSFWRRATSEVTVPSRLRVEVSARSPEISAGRCSPNSNFRFSGPNPVTWS